MTDRDKLFVYFRCGFKSLLIDEHTIDLSGSNQSVHGFLTRTVKLCEQCKLRILFKRALASIIHKFLFIILIVNVLFEENAKYDCLARFKSFNVVIKLSRVLRCTTRLNGIKKAYFDRINSTSNMF